MRKLLLFVSLLLVTLAAQATEPKKLTFTATNLTHTHVTAALNNANIGDDEPWIAVLASTVKTLEAIPYLNVPENSGSFAAIANSRCANLQAVQGGEGVTSIGIGTFAGCKKLSSVSFPVVESIGDYAFAGCTNLSTLSLGTALSTVENITFVDGVFAGVTTANIDLTLGAKVDVSGEDTDIANNKYNGYTFKSITVGIVEEVKTVIFTEANLTYAHVKDSLGKYSIGTSEPWIAVLESSVETLELTGSTGTFDTYGNGDARCTNLQSVQGGEGITSIGKYAFYKCTSLSSVSFPVATSIGSSAFEDCTNLSTLSLGTALSTVENITFVDGVFAGVTTANIDLTLGAKVDVSGEDTDIANNKYNGYTFKSITVGIVEAVKTVTFSEANLTHTHVTAALNNANIGDDEPWIAVLASTVKTLEAIPYLNVPENSGSFAAIANSRCANLQAVQGGEGVTSIGIGTFAGCKKLSSVSFPVVESIGDYAFAGCTNLSTLSLGTALSTVENITFVDGVFAGVTTANIDLTLGAKVDVSGEDTDIANNKYKGYFFKSITVGIVEEVKTVIFAKENLTCADVAAALAAANIGNDEPWIAVLESTVKTLEAISHPDIPMMSIGPFDAYRGVRHCANLQAVQGGEGVTSIVAEAFLGCTNLSSVSFPAITSIGHMTFLDCTNLSTLSLGTAFSTETGITFGLDVFNGVTTTNIDLTLGENVLAGTLTNNKYNGYTFKSITGGIVEEVKTVIFAKENLTYADVAAALDDAGVSASGEWIAVLESSVKELEAIPHIDAPVNIGPFAAFADPRCANLQTVQGGEGVTSIGDYAFMLCTSLSSASFPKVTDIGDYAFMICTSLSTLSLGTALSSERDITFGNDVFSGVTTTNNDLTLGKNVTITDTELANKQYKGYTFKSIKQSNITSIDNVQAEGKKVVGYYDLSGVKLRTEPESGIYIVTYDDGTSAKRMKK